jgi:hypothetical protein
MWALSEAGRARGLDAELAAQRKLGLESSDPYLVALAANIGMNAAPGAGETDAIVKRLAGMQAKDGSFPGAKESITMSGGEALLIESTSLATLAFIKAGRDVEAMRAVEWLNAHRGGRGTWGSTQSTVLALKAQTAWTEKSRVMAADGVAVLLVNGREAARVPFGKGRRDAIVLDDVASSLIAGGNAIELRLEGDAAKSKMPYAVAIEYRSARPPSSPEAKIAVTTKLASDLDQAGRGREAARARREPQRRRRAHDPGARRPPRRPGLPDLAAQGAARQGAHRLLRDPPARGDPLLARAAAQGRQGHRPRPPRVGSGELHRPRVVGVPLLHRRAQELGRPGERHGNQVTVFGLYPPA